MFISSKKEILASLKNIVEKFKQSQQIHLFLVPERFDDVNYNFHIKNVNEQNFDFVKPYQNVLVYNTKNIVDSWDYYDNLFIGRQGKVKICTEIARKILNNDKKGGEKVLDVSNKQPNVGAQGTKETPSKHTVKFKGTTETKTKVTTNSPGNLYQNTARNFHKYKPQKGNFFNKKNRRNSYVYYPQQSTTRSPRYEYNDEDMTFTIPNDLFTDIMTDGMHQDPILPVGGVMPPITEVEIFNKQ